MNKNIKNSQSILPQPLLYKSDFPIVILCGGKSSRMQQDKSLLPFAQCKTLVEYQYKRLSKYFSNVFLSTKEYKFNFLDKRSSHIIYDTNQTLYSPLVALKTLLETIHKEKIFILTVDTPFISIDTIIKLIENSMSYDVTIATTSSRQHNLCGVFSLAIINEINAMLSEDIHKIGYLLKKVNTKEVLFESENEFLNLNTPNDYDKAIELNKHII